MTGGPNRPHPWSHMSASASASVLPLPSKFFWPSPALYLTTQPEPKLFCQVPRSLEKFERNFPISSAAPLRPNTRPRIRRLGRPPLHLLPPVTCRPPLLQPLQRHTLAPPLQGGNPLPHRPSLPPLQAPTPLPWSWNGVGGQRIPAPTVSGSPRRRPVPSLGPLQRRPAGLWW
jgi:hypothetical protein